MNKQSCRLCNHLLSEVFVDLGRSPLANAILHNKEEFISEKFYPLCAYVCSSCFLVQLPAVATREHIFNEYSYFSSYSRSWLQASEKYANDTVARFAYDSKSLVLEIGSNDGYLLQYFKRKNIKVLGIEPAKNVAEVAIKKGVPTRALFFGVSTAEMLLSEKIQADHIIVKNVLAHVPDLHDFIEGIKRVLKVEGTISIEFPSFLNLMKFRQFDTIYHEHFCYLSLLVVEKAFKMHGLNVFDVEEVATHGGSLRVWASHKEDLREQSKQLLLLRKIEQDAELDKIKTYTGFQKRAQNLKENLVVFLRREKMKGKTIAAYGAPAKGNTLLNFCGIGTELVDFTVDLNPYKQGCFLPGTHLPIYSPEKIREMKPDYLLILPWNLKKEICLETAFIADWGGKHLIPIPEVEVYSGNTHEISRNAA